MYFAYHCYLAQPIQDEHLASFLENLGIFYTANSPATFMATLTRTPKE